MKKKNQRRASRAVRTVARKESLSLDSVRKEMKTAIAEGMSNPDPAIKEIWKEIACNGEVPEPEDVIAWVVEQVKVKLTVEA